MRKILLTALLMIIMFCSNADAQVNINVNLGGPASYGNYYTDLSEYYKIPPGHLKKNKWKHIREDELPLVYYIAGRARVEPSVVAQMRLGGKNWLNISLNYGVTPEAYYVPIGYNPGPPYGKAYGYYRNRAREQWRYIRLSDDDMVNLVNLRFISEFHGINPGKVVEMRGKGIGFVKISEDVNNQLKGKKGNWKMENDNKKTDKSEGKGHKESHGNGNKGGGKGKGKNK